MQLTPEWVNIILGIIVTLSGAAVWIITMIVKPHIKALENVTETMKGINEVLEEHTKDLTQIKTVHKMRGCDQRILGGVSNGN